MSTRRKVWLFGCAAGIIGASATWCSAMILKTSWGTVAAFAVAAVASGYAANLAAEELSKRIRRHLDCLGGTEPEEPIGLEPLDRNFAEVRATWNSRGRQNDHPKPERRARDQFAELRTLATELSRDARDLFEAARRVAAGAEDQSRTVARTANTVESLSEKIDSISTHADDAARAAERARQEARNGLGQIHEVVEGMDHLRARVEANGRKARRLGDRSVEIGAIVELINGISSRTDMLALNATIESVRAGEHGRGFAVVAEEIRKLAERTATATREIGTLVEAIQADAHESLRALGEEQAAMEQESQRAREAGSALESISEAAEQSARIVEGISRSTNDQVLATQDLVLALQHISEVAQTITSETEESRDHARSLTDRCERWLSSQDMRTGDDLQKTPARRKPHVLSGDSRS